MSKIIEAKLYNILVSCISKLRLQMHQKSLNELKVLLNITTKSQLYLFPTQQFIFIQLFLLFLQYMKVICFTC